MKVPTPLIIIQARTGTTVEEVHRARAAGESDLDTVLAVIMATAVMGNPDEIIVRILRPQVE